MNLWVNRIGQLATLAVALFFLSCQEDASVLGYKNPNSKFKVSYVEIPIESSVLLRDSMRTSNFSFAGEPNRLLVGTYLDEKFGNITAGAVSQYFATTYIKVGSTAVFDSVTVQFQFDFYHYGATGKTPQMLSIYELERELKYDSIKNYFNKTTVPYTTLLGNKTFTIDPSEFDKFAKSSTDADTVITIRLPLNNAFGQKLFNTVLRFRDATSTADSLYMNYSEFIKEFKGIVIKAESGDKIVGFSPSAAGTRLLLHYHETDKDSLVVPFGFSSVMSFNQITSQRGGSALAQVTTPYQEYLKDDDNRYVESGIGILTKLDFSNYYAFLDTVPNILINSAQLVVESVESSNLPPPSLLSLRLLKDNNRLKKFSRQRPQDLVDYTAYRGYVRYDFASQTIPALIDNDSVFYAYGDRTGSLSYSSATNSYSMVMALFLQQLSVKADYKTAFKYFALYPASQPNGTPQLQISSKSLERAVFPKDKIKLKIYYTKPTTAQ